MNCDLILGIDWLKQHNPLINWESNHLTFLCCKSHSIDLKSRDAQFSNCSSPVLDISIVVLSVNNFFRQSWVQAFSFLNFVPNSTIVGASVSNPIPVTLETSHHVPGTLEYIKSRVLVKYQYHSFINVFVDKEATQLPPH